MNRRDQWRHNIRRDMLRELALDAGLVPHIVVATVVNGERTDVALTAASGPPEVVYMEPDDGSHHRALIASIYRAQMEAATG